MSGKKEGGEEEVKHPFHRCASSCYYPLDQKQLENAIATMEVHDAFMTTTTMPTILYKAPSVTTAQYCRKKWETHYYYTILLYYLLLSLLLRHHQE